MSFGNAHKLHANMRVRAFVRTISGASANISLAIFLFIASISLATAATPNAPDSTSQSHLSSFAAFNCIDPASSFDAGLLSLIEATDHDGEYSAGNNASGDATGLIPPADIPERMAASAAFVFPDHPATSDGSGPTGSRHARAPPIGGAGAAHRA